MGPPVTIDFETHGIEDRPNYPPAPVGLSILDPLGEWAPPTGAYIVDMEVAGRWLKDLYASKRRVLMHNAKFDMEVAQKAFGLPILPWDRFDDTLFELFLHNPHAISLSLKPAAKELLDLPPEEQDLVHQWIYRHGLVKTMAQKNWGAFISHVPREITAPYAIGDVFRTWKLHEKLYPTFDEGMLDAYDRERKLLPILLRNEQEGMRVDVEALKRDIVRYRRALDTADHWIRSYFGRPTLNPDSDAEVAEALRATGIVKAFVKTKTGRDSVSKKNLTRDMFTDPAVHDALGYRSRLTTALSQSMVPWLEMAERNNGYIFTSWNQVRQAHGDDGKKGTRTGRLSCSRFQNITKDWYDKGDYTFPAWLGVPDLPLVRRYIRGDPGALFCHRDYNQQEFRILAHYENAALARMYLTNREMNMHTWMHSAIRKATGLDISHRPIKIINFMELYGGGSPKMAGAIGTDIATVEKLRAAKRKVAPGIEKLSSQIQKDSRLGLAIRTWGGRKYYAEEPRIIDQKLREFHYKLLNYKIQGSAADCTKQAVIDYDAARQHGRFLVTVHDEIDFSCPKEFVRKEAKILHDVMFNVRSLEGPFRVPMHSDAKVGITWGNLTKLDEVEQLELTEVA